MEVNEKIKELGIRIRNLESELRTNQMILAQYYDNLEVLMKENKINKIEFPDNYFAVILWTKVNVSFNTTKFKKKYPKIHEKYRISSKRFSQKKLKEEEPVYYDEFLESTESQSIEIEKLEEVLPSFGDDYE